MIRWCSYCQRYLGEVAPFDDYSFTHSLCEACDAAGVLSDEEAVKRIGPIARFYGRVTTAGLSGGTDPVALVEEGLALGLAPFDLLIGMIQPALYQMGAAWANAERAIHEEHQLSAACAAIVQLVFERQPGFAALRQSLAPQVLLVNAEDNFHTLGLQLVEFFLLSRSIPVFAVVPGLPTREVLALAASLKPRTLGISCALPTQLRSARATAEGLASLPAPRPVVCVGGFGVREPIRVPREMPLRICVNMLDLHAP